MSEPKTLATAPHLQLEWLSQWSSPDAHLVHGRDNLVTIRALRYPVQSSDLPNPALKSSFPHHRQSHCRSKSQGPARSNPGVLCDTPRCQQQFLRMATTSE